MMPKFDAWAIGRLLIGESLNGELGHVSPAFRGAANHLSGLDPEARPVAWAGYLAGRPEAEAEALIRAIANAKPHGAPPKPDPPERCATLADLRRTVADDQWLWKGWIARGVLNGLAAVPGTGKTIMATDLIGRLWFGENWPDGQANSLPARTRTLVVPADRHFTQLLSLAEGFGLPDEAVLINAPRATRPPAWTWTWTTRPSLKR
jgi:hypothetical protein